jgi:hypothetical protein
MARNVFPWSEFEPPGALFASQCGLGALGDKKAVFQSCVFVELQECL